MHYYVRKWDAMEICMLATHTQKCLVSFHACVSFLSFNVFLCFPFNPFGNDRFQKRDIEGLTINEAKELIDIDNVISFNSNNTNNSNAQPTPNGGASSAVDANKFSPVPFTATTMSTTMLSTTSNTNHLNESNDDYDGRHFFESSASYLSAFNIETIVLLFMFTVCTIIYSSKYRMSLVTGNNKKYNIGTE